MDIRRRLTFQFLTIVALIIFLASIAIYFFSADYRQNDFYNRLKNKASNVAKLLIEVEEVDADLLTKMEADNPLSLPEEKIVIYNFRNEILYSSDHDRELKISPEILDKIRLEDEIQTRQGEHEILGFLYADQYDRFVVIASAVDIYGRKKLKNLRTILAIVFASSLVVVFFSGRIYSGRAMAPIARVINHVNEISASNLNTRLEDGKENDEIARLSQTFNKMLDRLELAFNLQKNFIANASHELRTPLTAITGQLEVVLLNDRTKPEYKQAIISVLEDMKSLNNLSNRLLLLAQASSETSVSDSKPVRIDDLLWQIRSEMLKRHPEYEIQITFDPSIDDDDKMIISGNESLIKIAFNNLIDNGCKYAEDHSVEVKMEYKQKEVVVRFIDSGIGIPPDDLAQIFEPFYRGKNSFSKKGHGIGLSLVKRIVLSHGGRITIDSQLNKGTTVIVQFPSKF